MESEAREDDDDGGADGQVVGRSQHPQRSAWPVGSWWRPLVCMACWFTVPTGLHGLLADGGAHWVAWSVG